MKKCVLAFLFFISAIISLSAQKGGYAKGDKLLNLGIGINSYYNSGIPFGASFEVGITEVISVGGNIDYLSSKYNYGAGFNAKFTSIYLGARGSYHFNEILNIENKKIDLYAGATIGYRNFSFKDNFSGSNLSSSYGNGVFFGGFAGGKYYFGNAIGAFAEFGAIGSTNARIGIGLKF